jgi:hypothetical protein
MRGQSVLRKQTSQFIAENPTDVVITRQVMKDDGAGGSIPDGPPSSLDPQRVRVVIKSLNQQIEFRTVEGEVLKPEYSIVGEYDADIREGDSFTYDGNRIEVVFVFSIGDYERRAEAVRRG